MRTALAISLALIVCTPAFAQEEVSIFMEKTVHGRAQQGMSVWGNYFFCLEDGGHVNVYPFKKGARKPVGSFDLASSSKDNHSNNAEFGVEKKPGASFPLMYVSVGKPGAAIDWVCNVESITRKGKQWSSELAQQIILDKCDGWKEAGYTEIFGAPSWLVDKERNTLWVFSAIQRTTPQVTKRNEDNLYVATMFRIPTLSEGKTVHLGVRDILKQVTLPYDIGFTQAGCVIDGIIYYCFGVGNESANRPAAMRAYDTDNGTILRRYDIFHQVLQEPEDLVVIGNWIYLGTNGGRDNTPLIYKIRK